MQILLYFLLTLHVLTCLLIVLVVLMQRPRSEGLGAAFGGGMTENIFGAQTTHVLAKFTTWLGGFFFLVTLALAMVYAHINSSQTSIQRQLLESARESAAAESAATTPTPAVEETTAPVVAATPASPAAATPEAPAVADTPAVTTADPAEAPAPAEEPASEAPVEETAEPAAN